VDVVRGDAVSQQPHVRALQLLAKALAVLVTVARELQEERLVVAPVGDVIHVAGKDVPVRPGHGSNEHTPAAHNGKRALLGHAARSTPPYGRFLVPIIEHKTGVAARFAG